MNAIKLPFHFDADRIKQEISQFTKEDYYDIYNPSVALKTLWSKHLIDPINDADGIPVFLPNNALKKCTYILSILETFKCHKETFRIHTLDAGASIQPHKDMGYSLDQGKVRIHIPVTTSSNVELIIDNQLIKMKPGECWYCNFNETHEVHNKSNQPRTHLIIDCLVNDWLRDLIISSKLTSTS